MAMSAYKGLQHHGCQSNVTAQIPPRTAGRPGPASTCTSSAGLQGNMLGHKSLNICTSKSTSTRAAGFTSYRAIFTISSHVVVVSPTSLPQIMVRNAGIPVRQ